MFSSSASSPAAAPADKACSFISLRLRMLKVSDKMAAPSASRGSSSSTKQADTGSDRERKDGVSVSAVLVKQKAMKEDAEVFPQDVYLKWSGSSCWWRWSAVHLWSVPAGSGRFWSVSRGTAHLSGRTEPFLCMEVKIKRSKPNEVKDLWCGSEVRQLHTSHSEGTYCRTCVCCRSWNEKCTQWSAGWTSLGSSSAAGGAGSIQWDCKANKKHVSDNVGRALTTVLGLPLLHSGWNIPLVFGSWALAHCCS